MMTVEELLTAYGFNGHPFTQVAAEKEERLAEYFVSPKYFPDVLGTADSPRPYVVFGPRGGGKSAIRIMIENYAYADDADRKMGGRVLCVTYDDFSVLTGSGSLRRISLAGHVNEILKSAVTTLAALAHSGRVCLSCLDDDAMPSGAFSANGLLSPN